MINVIAAYSNVKDEHGLIQPDGKESGNGLRYTAEAVMAYEAHRDILEPIALKEEYQTLVDAARSCAREPGLYGRTPNNSWGQNSNDDYVGLAVISYYIDETVVQDILTYGRKTWGFYNNIHPGKKTGRSFLWRFIVLFATLRWAAGQKPNIVQRALWALGVFFSDDSQDGFVLAWMSCHIAAKEGGRLEKRIARMQSERLARAYTHGIGQVLDNYYGRQPSSIFLWDVLK